MIIKSILKRVIGDKNDLEKKQSTRLNKRYNDI